MTHKNETAWTWGALNARMGKRDHLKVMHLSLIHISEPTRPY